MKLNLKIYFLGLFAVIFVTGCATTQELKTTITTKVSSITENVDPAMVNKLPADKKAGFPRAEYNLNVAHQKVKLSEIKSELAANQKKYAGLEEDLANNFQREAEIDYDLVKIEAIISSEFGKKEDNLKLKASLQSKKLQVQAERIKIDANREATKRRSEYLSTDIARMDNAIKEMKFVGDKAPEPKTNGEK